MLDPLISTLRDRSDLSDHQVGLAVDALVSADTPVQAKVDFLLALATKGETVDEIAGFARRLRQRAVSPPISPTTRQGEILDVCGTGGDRLNTFNISTSVAITVASSGVTVAKHGNRAITSQAGSADVLEELGIPIDLPPDKAARSLEETQFAFFFAPNYHPAFKNIAPARKACAERGQRTIFNFLGPLLNPALPTAQLLGVPNPALCEPLARVLHQLGLRRAMVVSGKIENHSLDEISSFGPTSISEFYHDRGFHSSTLQPSDFGLARGTLADLQGGDKKANAAILQAIFDREERGPKRDAVVLNSAAALFVSSKVKSLTEGIELASELLDSGQARKKLDQLVAFRP